MKKITDSKDIKRLRLTQYIVLLVAIYLLMIKNNSDYGIFWVIGINWFMLSLLPCEYRGGFGDNQKNVFFDNIDPLIENFIVLMIVLMIIILMIIFQ